MSSAEEGKFSGKLIASGNRKLRPEEELNKKYGYAYTDAEKVKEDMAADKEHSDSRDYILMGLGAAFFAGFYGLTRSNKEPIQLQNKLMRGTSWLFVPRLFIRVLQL